MLRQFRWKGKNGGSSFLATILPSLFSFAHSELHNNFCIARNYAAVFEIEMTPLEGGKKETNSHHATFLF